MNTFSLPIGHVSKSLLLFNVVVSLIYFSWWFLPGHVGNIYLYSLLFIGEIYHLIMALTFWFTIYPRKRPLPSFAVTNLTPFTPPVDIYIPVAGEPLEVIKETVQAAKQLHYPKFKIYLLNDGLVAKKDNWRDVEQLAKEMKVTCITRTVPGGAKAGNINHALRMTKGKIIVIFDSDMAPFPEFLLRVIPFFTDKTVGFVQTPQYYANADLNSVTGGAWEQQSFFFGPIMAGKNTSNAAFICGTNVAIRREALQEVGGMNEKNIAEDFLTSLAIHAKGWKSYYLPEVLATGLAPEDLLSYFKQQLRWARGSLEVLFGANPLFKRGLTISQKIHYLSSALYYFNGVIVLIDMLMPLIFLGLAIQPVAATTTSFALFFIPFMLVNLTTLYQVSADRLTFRAISFSQGSWYLQLVALTSLLLRRKMGFAVTSKQKLTGNFLHLIYPHLSYTLLAVIVSGIAINREGLSPAVMTNIAWAMLNVAMFLPFIRAAFRWERLPESSFSIPALHQ